MWAQSFLLGVAGGGSVFAVEGEGCTTMQGAATPWVPNPGQPAIWNHSGAALPAWENFLVPFFRAVIQEALIPSKEDVIGATKIAVTDDITTVKNMNANDTRCQSRTNCFNEGPGHPNPDPLQLHPLTCNHIFILIPSLSTLTRILTSEP